MCGADLQSTSDAVSEVYGHGPLRAIAPVMRASGSAALVLQDRSVSVSDGPYLLVSEFGKTSQASGMSPRRGLPLNIAVRMMMGTVMVVPEVSVKMTMLMTTMVT